MYYRSRKVNNLLMTNNPYKKDCLRQTNVIYKYACNKEDCKLLTNINYIGETSTTLSRRLTMRLQDGAIKKHYRMVHKPILDRFTLENNVTILKQINDHNRLKITDALLIKENAPFINNQDSGQIRTLKLWT